MQRRAECLAPLRTLHRSISLDARATAMRRAACGIELKRWGRAITVIPSSPDRGLVEPMNEAAKRRRRWTKERKWAIARESFDPVTSLKAVAERHGVNPSQLSRWRRLYRDTLLALARTQADEEAATSAERTE
ncbi:transposase [Burkholderia gladioli]|uniref:transposase n=1 Tax=Burkholderia gladioli TaxID=28095 RepID=UPI001364934D|nr:transposase [Burkholderia gladioli]MBA1363798.1 transposase [Burkholderia gladioli]MDN7498934.1 transposase [Burkholderia gladioli]MDN7720171.1 transposase [Burkholderia gladioli]WAG21872.1 transposase [Burkholderia gladioli]